MFRPPISQVKVRAPTNVHFTLDPAGINPSISVFATLTATFDADVLLYTYAEYLYNGIPSGTWASTSAGPTSLLVANVRFDGGIVGDIISMRVKHTVVSGGGYPTDSDWITAPETYIVGP